jgi:hypothetical protein
MHLMENHMKQRWMAILILLAANFCSAETIVKAVRLTAPITLDGKLLEPFWKDENAVTEFVQHDPVEGAKPSEKTVVDVAFDDQAVYIGARMYDSDPKAIEARLVRRDVDTPADTFVFYVDPYHDKRTGYYFGINAAGTLYDGREGAHR